MRCTYLVILLLFLTTCSASSQDDSFNTHYEVYGTGDPLLLINGGPGFSSEGFRSLAKQLANRLNKQVIIYDQRGTGQSTLNKHSRETIKMDLMVNDIESLRQKLAFDQWSVMGHSFGGMLAYYYAAKHPDRIIKMVQSSSGGVDLSLVGRASVTDRLTSSERDSLSYYSRLFNSGDTSYHVRYKRGYYMAPAYIVNKEYRESVARRLTQGDLNLNGLVWSNINQIRYDVKDELKDFENPVLIIHGEFDIVPTSIAVNSNKLLPNSHLAIIEESNHYPWLDNPEDFFKALEKFFESGDSKN